MYFLMAIALLAMGLLLLIWAMKKSRAISRITVIPAILGIFLTGVSLSMLFLVLSGQVILPLQR